MMSTEKYVTIFSNMCTDLFPANQCNEFKNKLFTPLTLESSGADWQMALIDISFPFKCLNIEDGISIGFLAPIRVTTAHRMLDEHVLESTLISSSDKAEDIETIAEESGIETSTMDPMSLLFRYAILPPAYYYSVSDLATAIVNLYHSLFYNLYLSGDLIFDLCFSYNAMKNQISFFACPLNPAVNATISQNFLSIFSSNESIFKFNFGLESRELTDDQMGLVYEVDIPTMGLYSIRPCNLLNYTNLYVCSQIVDYQHVGNKYNKLLATARLDKTGKFRLSTTPRYLPIQRTYQIDTLDIELYSSLLTFAPFPFPITPSFDDYVECTIHFKSASIL